MVSNRLNAVTAKEFSPNQILH